MQQVDVSAGTPSDMELGRSLQIFNIGIWPFAIPWIASAGLAVAAVYLWITRAYSMEAIATSVLSPVLIMVGVVAFIGRLKSIELFENGCEVLRGDGVRVRADWGSVELFCWQSISNERGMRRRSDSAKLVLLHDLEVDVSSGELRGSSELLAHARERLTHTLLTSTLQRIIDGGNAAFGCIHLSASGLVVVDSRDTSCAWSTVRNAQLSFESCVLWTGENYQVREMVVSPAWIPNAHVAVAAINILAGYDANEKKSVSELVENFHQRKPIPPSLMVRFPRSGGVK